MRTDPIHLLVALALATAPCCAVAQVQDTKGSADLRSTLPTASTRRAIETLATPSRADLEKKAFPAPKSLVPEPAGNSGPQMQATSGIPDAKASEFLIPNTLLLQFKPDVSASAIDDYVKSRKLTVLRKFPSIGSVQVEADLRRFFDVKPDDKNYNSSLIRGALDAAKFYQDDPRILSAAPDVLLRKQADEQIVANLVSATDVFMSNPAAPTEVTDWGVANIEADALWKMPGARDGTIFGVMDVGFARHNDLPFLNIAGIATAHDHGNHVAGIACARHNGEGIRGVLPGCVVKPQTTNEIFQSAGDGVPRFSVTFSQTIATLVEFITRNDDTSVFNVSLGYNWRSNFGINPDDPDSAYYRQLVEQHGAFLLTAFEAAAKRGKMIFSAAGNDSYGLPVPMRALYASPFNWAAFTARATRGIGSGVVVEAHDSQGRRARFSNSGGNISCPGVDIVSTIAFSGPNQLSPDVYGKMSGTSMAAPYCAAGYTLFRLVRPGFSPEGAIDCLLRSTAKTTSGVPMMKLSEALGRCLQK